MKLLPRFVAGAAALCLTTLPAFTAPVAGPGTLTRVFVPQAAPPMMVGCNDNNFNRDEDQGGGDSVGGGEGDGGDSFTTGFGFGQPDENAPILVECEGSGSTFHKSGPGKTDIVVDSIGTGVEHCGQYTDVWRIDCISDELARMAQKMPRTSNYSKAKSEILAASAKLQAIAQQNADPRQPPVRRTAQVGNVKRTTTRPIVAVAPDRVVAANRAADAVITELSTTLLRSAGNSPTTMTELARVSQAVDSTKVLLRST